MARANPKTTNLSLPLSVAGIAALQNTVKNGFVLIDAAIAALQGGTGIAASEILYDSGNPGDSNSGATSVQAALDDLYAEVTALRLAINSSNSGDIAAV